MYKLIQFISPLSLTRSFTTVCILSLRCLLDLHTENICTGTFYSKCLKSETIKRVFITKINFIFLFEIPFISDWLKYFFKLILQNGKLSNQHILFLHIYR